MVRTHGYSIMRLGAAVFLAVLTLGACSHQAQVKDPNARPKSPADLRIATANLDLSGPASGHVSAVRLAECSTRRDGEATNFYAAVYFQLRDHWYFLQLIGTNRLPVPDGNYSYTGPATYRASLDFRDLLVTSSATLNGEHAWGASIDSMAALRVGPGAKVMTIQSVANVDPRQPTYADEIKLWPSDPNAGGPAVSPIPSEDQIVRIRGSWEC